MVMAEASSDSVFANRREPGVVSPWRVNVDTDSSLSGRAVCNRLRPEKLNTVPLASRKDAATGINCVLEIGILDEREGILAKGRVGVALESRGAISRREVDLGVLGLSKSGG